MTSVAWWVTELCQLSNFHLFQDKGSYTVGFDYDFQFSYSIKGANFIVSNKPVKENNIFVDASKKLYKKSF